MKQRVSMSRVGFCNHDRETTKKLTKCNAFGRILNFWWLCHKYEHVSINDYEVMRLVRVLCQLEYVSLSSVGYLNKSKSRNFNNEAVCE